MVDWVRVKREDVSKREGEPIITIRTNQFHFNGRFAKEAELEKRKAVLLFLKETERKIAFKFLDSTSDKEAYRLHGDGGSGRTHRSRGRVIKATNVITRTPWIKGISLLTDKSLRQFTPEWNNIERHYEICLAPSFELRVYDKDQIPSDVKGVYRYLRENRVVYIGQGNIRERTNQPERLHWDYDTIEYSTVGTETEMLKWEKFWLDKHSEENGKLPEYNKIGGINRG